MLKGQRGMCAYSDVPMEVCVPNSHWRMSLERSNNSRGYSCDNCLLIAAEFNSGDWSRHKGVDQSTVIGTAQWSLAKVQTVYDLRKQEVDLKVLRPDIRKARQRGLVHSPFRRAKPPLAPSSQEPGQIYCSACARFLSLGNFTSSRRARGCGYCKQRVREYNRASTSTLRGHVKRLLTNGKKKGMTFSLTGDQVLSMLEQQGGRCYYSGVPLQYKQVHTDWRMSIERLDNSKGYTAENWVLIAIEFNTGDFSRNTAVTKVFGTAQWSREKVEHIWGKDGWAKKSHATPHACD
eukprot:Skav232917  [mRNA]  locus=scaffold1477:695670:696545:- [translate_table: standard]